MSQLDAHNVEKLENNKITTEDSSVKSYKI